MSESERTPGIAEQVPRPADAFARLEDRVAAARKVALPAKHLLPVEQTLPLDQWAVQQAFDVQQAVIAAYERYDFPDVVARVQNFCTNEMGALYLDITKDRLYTMPTDSHGRRSAQSAMFRIAEALVRWLAPILAFTAEEIWQQLPGERGESVLFETWYGGLAATQASPEQRRWWADLLAIREARFARARGHAQGRPDRRLAGGEAGDPCRSLAGRAVRAGAGGAEVLLHHLGGFAGSADATRRRELPRRILRTAKPGSRRSSSDAAKCVRCWHRRADVGSHAGTSGAVRPLRRERGGAGRDRRWF